MSEARAAFRDLFLEEMSRRQSGSFVRSRAIAALQLIREAERGRTFPFIDIYSEMKAVTNRSIWIESQRETADPPPRRPQFTMSETCMGCDGDGECERYDSDGALLGHQSCGSCGGSGTRREHYI